MRLKLLGRLIFALALTIQVFSPVASSVARAGSANPVFQICLKAALDFATRDQQSPDRSGRHGNGDCLLCQLSCDGSAPVGAVVHDRRGARAVANYPLDGGGPRRADPTKRKIASTQGASPLLLTTGRANVALSSASRGVWT